MNPVIRKIDSEFAIKALNIDSKITSLDRTNYCLIVTIGVIIGIALAIYITMVGVKIKHSAEFRERMFVSGKDRLLHSGGSFLSFTGWFMGCLGGLLGSFMTGCIHHSIRNYRLSRLQNQKDFFQNQNQHFLNEQQLRRLLTEAQTSQLPHILERCLTEKEWRIVEDVLGRQKLDVTLSRIPTFAPITSLFNENWRENFKNFNYQTLKDPHTFSLFQYLVKKCDFPQRLLIAKWLFESGANPLNYDHRSKPGLIYENPHPEYPLTCIQLGAFGKYSSSLTENYACDTKGHDLKSLQEKMIFIMRLKDRDPEKASILHFIQAIDKEELTNRPPQEILKIASRFFDVFFKESLELLCTQEELDSLSRRDTLWG